MKYSEGRPGRVFVIRLEHGEIVHETVEQFAWDHGVTAGALIILGGADAKSELVAGPVDGDARPVETINHRLTDVHEVAGTGTLFPDESGAPMLHAHIACGRRDGSVVGCIRRGVRVWQIMEIVLFELTGTDARRRPDPELGFMLLAP